MSCFTDKLVGTNTRSLLISMVGSMHGPSFLLSGVNNEGLNDGRGMDVIGCGVCCAGGMTG